VCSVRWYTVRSVRVAYSVFCKVVHSVICASGLQCVLYGGSQCDLCDWLTVCSVR
jgi:hypothetical protein